VEDCKSSRPLLSSTVNPHDNEIAESAQGESRQLGDKIADFEPCPTVLSPHSLDAANRLSPGLGVTPPGPLAAAGGTSPPRSQVSAAGYNSGCHLSLPSGKSGVAATAIDTHGQEDLPGRKAVSGPPNEYESRVVPTYMSSGSTKRKSTSPLPETLPPAPAKRNCRDVFAKCVCSIFRLPPSTARLQAVQALQRM
jgi:hypothetical protein